MNPEMGMCLVDSWNRSGERGSQWLKQRERGSARWQGQISVFRATIKHQNNHLNEIKSRWVVSYLKQEKMDMIQLTFQKDHLFDV